MCTVLFLISYLLCNIQDYIDWYKWEDSKHPLSNAPEPKRRFIPSKWEAKKVIIPLLASVKKFYLDNEMHFLITLKLP